MLEQRGAVTPVQHDPGRVGAALLAKPPIVLLDAIPHTSTARLADECTHSGERASAR